MSLVAAGVFKPAGELLLGVPDGLFGGLSMQLDFNEVPIPFGVANTLIGHVMSIACDPNEEASLTV